MVDFAKLKNKKNFNDLAEKIAKATAKKTYEADNRIFNLGRDKAGNGSAIIRFLPGLEDEDPFTKYYSHGFKGPTGRWYIERSLTTIGKDDPVGEYNSKLWNATDSDESPQRKLARENKRRLRYVSNIYVIKDTNNPDNEGKVFLYEYGQKIFDKIADQMNPGYEDQEKVNPFDLWEGANFRLRMSIVEGYPNFDKSMFDTPSKLFKTDEELEEVYNQQHSLKPYTDEKEFKSYSELKEKFIAVMGLTEEEFEAGALPGTLKSSRKSFAKTVEIDEDEAPPFKTQKIQNKKQIIKDDDDDDAIALFKSLAEDDE